MIQLLAMVSTTNDDGCRHKTCRQNLALELTWSSFDIRIICPLFGVRNFIKSTPSKLTSTDSLVDSTFDELNLKNVSIKSLKRVVSIIYCLPRLLQNSSSLLSLQYQMPCNTPELFNKFLIWWQVSAGWLKQDLQLKLLFRLNHWCISVKKIGKCISDERGCGVMKVAS